MSDTALLVIDVQESFRHRPYWTDAGVPAFLDRLQALIDGCAERGVPVVQILHVEDAGAFSLASGWVTALAPLRLTPDVVFHKRFHSALAATPLGPWLTERGIRRLIVTGIRTEECCETTTRHASDSGFTVDYVTEATLTFPIRLPGGRIYSAEEIRERTEVVLRSGGFARIATVDELLQELGAGRELAAAVS
jgi:nicotinamidase-related amidase